MSSASRDESSPPPVDPSLLATGELLRLAQSGDGGARERLVIRYLPRLTRWAVGRLPLRARSLLDTGDLVHETLVRVLQRLENIRGDGSGGFQAYVRQAILNRLRDEVRWAALRPATDAVPEDLNDRAPSPLENVIGADVLARYERGLAGLEESDRELVHLRVELDFDYKEIAMMTGRTTPDAARMAVQRALARLAIAMQHER